MPSYKSSKVLDDHGHSHGGGEGHDHGIPLLEVEVLDAPAHAPGSSAAKKDTNKGVKKVLIAAACLAIVFMIGEVVGGYLAHSLAIMTDAAHLLSDVAAFCISLFAVWLAERPPTGTHTFGFHRIEALGALVSVLLIWGITGVLVYEAVGRIIHPQDVDGKIMFIVASLGLCVNLGMMQILHSGGGSHHGHSHGGDDHGHAHGGGEGGNINVRAAFIHAVGDLIQSIGVMIAAAVIWAVPSARLADPICTFLFSILVLFTTFGIVKQGITTLLNTVPAHIDLAAVATDLQRVAGVSNVHDLHVWSFGSDRVAMTVHLVADDPTAAIREAQAIANRHGIRHSTIQAERCGTADVAACYTHNEHVEGCALPPLPAKKGGGFSALLARPVSSQLHDGPGGCGGLLSPEGYIEAAQERGHGCGGHDDHGHAHGGGDDHHDHAHAGEEDPSHAHRGGDNHGHSCGSHDDHGHAHGGDDHGHAHGDGDDHGHAHGHAHGDGEDHGHGCGSQDDHGHAHGEDHGHAHGDGEDGHAH